MIPALAPDTPVLIAGPTASGKSALALSIARAQGGVVVNADALQVYDGWRLLTARPSDADLSAAPHALYGHVPPDAAYSVGHWLRDVAPLLGRARPIIVGGTGLYFTALTEGLADIPPTPDHVRAAGDALPLPDLLAQIDTATRARIDTANRARVQRAWEVLQSTGRGLAAWQDDTPPPLLPLDRTLPLLIAAPKDWLTPRIARRFDQMLDQGALAEAAAMRPTFDAGQQSARAIGADALIAHLDGKITLTQAREAAVVATRQYAKRQRTYFARRMAGWHRIDASSTELSTALPALR